MPKKKPKPKQRLCAKRKSERERLSLALSELRQEHAAVQLDLAHHRETAFMIQSDPALQVRLFQVLVWDLLRGALAMAEGSLSPAKLEVMIDSWRWMWEHGRSRIAGSFGHRPDGP